MSSILPSMSRRRALWLAGGLAGGMALHGCSQSSAASSPNRSGLPLVSAVSPWPGYAGHYVAFRKDFFYEEGLTVQETFFQSTTEANPGFLAGNADVYWATSGDAIDIISKDRSICAIYVVDYSNGADGILGRGVDRPEDLKGKTIACENSLFENVLLRAYLAKGGLTVADIKLEVMTAGDAATAFSAGHVDAAVTYEPWLTKAAIQGDGKIIFTTKDTNLIADVIVTRRKVIETRMSDLQAYVRAIDKAVKLLNAGDLEALRIVAVKLGISVGDAKKQIASTKIFDLQANKAFGFNPNYPGNIMKNFELNVKTAYDTKLIPELLDVNSLYDDSIVQSL
jgi:NitT/TauT family transport system substrate-binding protein